MIHVLMMYCNINIKIHLLLFKENFGAQMLYSCLQINLDKHEIQIMYYLIPLYPRFIRVSHDYLLKYTFEKSLKSKFIYNNTQAYLHTIVLMLKFPRQLFFFCINYIKMHLLCQARNLNILKL